MVFQNYALYPHMTVAQNLAFGLKLKKVNRVERDRRVADVAKILGLDSLLTRKPQALSGGQRQRVAMGRAIIRDPQAFLMDEPLSNLDAKLRVSMRAELGRLHSRLKVTTVYVTHDQIEAMTLGQRVAVMRDGLIQQVDKPQTLYSAPENLFVAAFIGSPAINLVEARIDEGAVFFGGFEIPLSANRQPPTGHEGAVIIGIRPETFESAEFGRPGLPTIDIDVDVIEELGSEKHVFFTIDAPKISTEELQAAASGDDGTLLAEERARFSARVNPDSQAQIGRSLKLAIDTQSIHFFDVNTGRNLLLTADTPSTPASAQ